MSDEMRTVHQMAIARRKTGICRRCPTQLDPSNPAHLCASCASKAEKRAKDRLNGPPTFDSWERSESRRGVR